MNYKAPSARRASAVVFAYSNVGARCLEVLLRHGVDVPLVITHDDDPDEPIWFDSVAGIAAARGVACIAPADPNASEVVDRVCALHPDFLFSFYYRRMLGPRLLAVAARGALNIHGSLLPKYRGRAPVNWAVLNGETETGATLHYMVEKPDAGDIVAQATVRILPDETGRAVSDKVTEAAASILDAALPQLVAGNAPRVAQNLSEGSYYGGRKPEDGRIDWSRSAREIHNLVRAVAPPFPGAFTALGSGELRVLRTRIADESTPAGPARLRVADGRLLAECGGGGRLEIIEAELAGRPFDSSAFATLCRDIVPLTSGAA